MPAITPSVTAATARLEQISTRLVFFIAGFGMAAWAPLIPFAKSHIGIDDRGLGLLLLCLGAGSVVMMPVAGALAARLGCRLMITLSVVFLCLGLPLAASGSSRLVLVVALFVFGAGVGALDVTMNIQALVIERTSKKPMMSGFHGLYSLGGIVGAAGVTLLLSVGASPLTGTLIVIGVIAAVLLVAAPHLLPYGSNKDDPAFALPRGVIWVVGALCFILFMTEGAVLDWSAVFLTSLRGMATAYSGWGYTIFAVMMTIGRLSGDWIVRRFGGNRIIIFGGICAASGLALTTFVPSWQGALLGYALVGGGCSNIVPVLFSSIARQTAMPENAAVPAITVMGYAGILIGPAAIGLVAHAVSLPAAFLIMASLLLLVAASCRLLRL